MRCSVPIDSTVWQIDRRSFLQISAAALGGIVLGGCGIPSARGPRPSLKFGLLTDTHYADANPNGKRFYRESIPKTQEAVTRLRAENLSFLGMLGDLKDMSPGEAEDRTFSHLVAIEREIQKFGGPTYHVLGNHDMDNLPKSRVLANIVNTGIAKDRGYYAFSRGGTRFIVLDATYDKDYRDYDRGKFDWRDSNIPPQEVAWLQSELTAAHDPVIVFVHQRLDGNGAASIRNREAVRKILESSGKVLAVFQGHDHPGAYTLINGIHYYTLRAVIEGSGPENNAYAVVEVLPSLEIVVTGYRRALSNHLAHAVT